MQSYLFIRNVWPKKCFSLITHSLVNFGESFKEIPSTLLYIFTLAYSSKKSIEPTDANDEIKYAWYTFKVNV